MVKDHVAEAIELFQSGFNCSQAVLSVFCEEFGLSEKIALKLSFPFGGGICGCGRTCGAVTGAIMVVGLKYETSNSAAIDNKAACKEMARKLIEAFEHEHGSSNCNDLVGFDMSQLSGVELKSKSQFLQNRCPKFLETVVAFLEEEL
jgi:C_GCAxxG_C_C family probable redox protein